MKLDLVSCTCSRCYEFMLLPKEEARQVYLDKFGDNPNTPDCPYCNGILECDEPEVFEKEITEERESDEK